MLLSEVDFARRGQSQPAPSSKVLLSNGQTVNITGNVSAYSLLLPESITYIEVAVWSHMTDQRIAALAM